MKLKVLVTLALLAAFAAVAGTAHAGINTSPRAFLSPALADSAAVAADPTTDPGTTGDPGTTDTTVWVQCADGTVWVIDTTEMNPDDFGAAVCADGYTVYSYDPSLYSSDPGATGSGTGDNGGDVGSSLDGGTNVGLGADPNMAPDPTLYSTEVQCPDGSIWAVATGDDFTCPSS